MWSGRRAIARKHRAVRRPHTHASIAGHPSPSSTHPMHPQARRPLSSAKRLHTKRWPPNAYRYDFETTHLAAKQFGINSDFFMFGAEGFGLLMWCGDLKAMRAGAAKVADAHKRSLARVQQGAATANGFAESQILTNAASPLRTRVSALCTMESHAEPSHSPHAACAWWHVTGTRTRASLL